MEDSQLESQVKIHKNKLSTIFSKIKDIIEQGRSISTDKSQLFLYKGMYKELKPYFNSFNETFTSLEELIGDKKTLSSKYVDLSQAVERYYYEGCAIYEEYMNPTPVPVQADRSVSVTAANSSMLNESRAVRARLPQINLPYFSGNPQEWPLFRDTYKSLIHDEATLSNMEKFLFLVSCLSGAARSLISNVSVIESNYVQAWKLINEHYNNRRKLANTYLKQVLEFKPFTGRPTTLALKSLLTSVVENIESLKHLGIEDIGDFLLSYLLIRCLDPVTKTNFEKKYFNVEFPTYQNLVEFIKAEWRSLDIHCTDPEPISSWKRSSSSNQLPASYRLQPPRNTLFSGNIQAEENAPFQQQCYPRKSQYRNQATQCCPVCHASHNLYQCYKFKSAPSAQKAALLKNWSGCTNCLSSTHPASSCASLKRCNMCNGHHHTWLHQPIPHEAARTSGPSTSTDPINKRDNDGTALGSLSGNGDVLLGTAIAQAKNVQGGYENIRLVTDSGSQFSFITAECASKLGLQVERCDHTIDGIGQVQLTSTLGRLTCTLRSLLSSSSYVSADVVVVTKITSNLPQRELPNHLQNRYRGYALADPEFYRPGPVDFLLGGDLFFDILKGPPIIVAPEIPRLLPTTFGYIIAGPLTVRSQHTREGTSFLIQSKADLKDVMNKFWEVEEVKQVTILSEEDDYCEKHFLSTHYRLDSGRYVVSLPVKNSIGSLQNTQGQAFKRLMTLESKLAKDEKLRNEYNKFMQEYVDLGHMKIVKPDTSAYTLPHHAVIKHQKDQLKIRTVFDASCKSSQGSLNDHLHTGPKLQLDIRDILTNFRLHKVVFTADIVKMYRQIQLNPNDRKYQHILWRYNPAEPVQEYELSTVTYGQSSAPFQAQRTVVQLVHDEGISYPLASRALLEDIYVDDIATGASSEKEAKKLQLEIIELLGKGCFELSKWASNSQALLSHLKDNQFPQKAVVLSSEDEPRVKLLGIQWIPNKDIFTYEVTVPTWHPSKRAILSAIARIYDPLGFLSPVVFYAKTILQEMWISQCNWDEMGPPHICHKWHQFISQLHELSQVRIPRHIVPDNSSSHMIVGFSDASQRGYSAVLYLLSRSRTDCQSHLIKAKTKLAPIKPMTIPRLELSGALLLSQLYSSCDAMFKKLRIPHAKFFKDSEVVLCWLSTPPEKLHAFVAHRVVKILDITQRSQWKHIKGDQNPADCSSRGILPSQLLNNSVWWAGPHWLKSEPNEWPSANIRLDNIPELKESPAMTLTATENTSNDILDWMEHFSSYSRLVGSMAIVLRFIQRTKSKSATISGPKTIQELRLSNKMCIKLIQSHVKIDEKHLKSLNAFIDDDGLLRVGGRLHNSSLKFDAMHPIIFPGKCHFTRRLIDYYHKTHLHLGPTALQGILQSKYWIISGRKEIRRRIYNCINCFKANKTPQAPYMGNLPTCRVDEGQVFHSVGVDFGGPFFIRESSRRKAAIGKAYLCLFICMTTKAVHLEVVSNCSTEAFIAALDRFIARRGKPQHMFSDCGTNFVGAANKLKDLIIWQRSAKTQDDITQHATRREITWTFNPPSAPHFGGLWEAGIKAAKTLLYRTIGETILTFEELSTLFCNIEGILNSRPITPVSSDPECIECLTPGHFIIGRSITSAPEEDLLNETITPLKRWNIIRQRSQHFWARWRNEYLNHLQQRRKWTSKTPNPEEGDLVIVKEPNISQRIWPLARILSVHPGKDGIVRVATIKTKTGVYKRPVTKLVPLHPVNNPDF